MALNIDYEKAAKLSQKFMHYGTSGFRSKAEDLDHVLYRTGLLSVLRSKKRKGETIGLMITASHNPDCDNGVKLIDPNGEMMEHSWEIIATTLINADNNHLEKTIQEIVENEKIDMNQVSSVFIGQDTRTSSPKLARLAIDGITALKGNCSDYKIVTTPVLHYMVYCMNKSPLNINNQKKDLPTENDYNNKLIDSFNFLNRDNVENLKYNRNLIVDCSNGVGALKVKELRNNLQFLKIRIYNDGNGILNRNCGADFVKVNQRVPQGIPLEPNGRCVSLDGDADRLIYFYLDDEKKFHMMDGDRIAILIADYLIGLIRKSNVDLKLGLVQTAYANGNSTRYITDELKVPASCVPTGVKHLHREAKKFDIGVYFEANGHGTVICNREVEETIRTAAESKLNGLEQRKGAARLLNIMKLINQTVGDAISDMLLVETILKAKDWSMADWEGCYTDLPNKLMKVTIRDRNVIETTDAERVCTKPEGLQQKINKCVTGFQNGRAFVRPSGTEDVVRVYSEASTQVEADELALMVASAVYEMAGGVGQAPTL